MRRLSPLLLLVLSACPKKAPATAASGAETIRLTYGWEPGWEADQPTTIYRTTEGPRGTVEEVVRARGTLTTASDGPDLVLTWTTGEVTGTPRTVNGETDPDPNADLMLDALAQASGVPLRTRVERDGSFAGLSEPEAYSDAWKTAMTDFMVALAESMDEEQAQEFGQWMQQLLPSMSPEQFTQDQAVWWAYAVAIWAGVDLEIGATYELKQGADPQTGVSTETLSFQVAGWEPCREDWDESPQCVRLIAVVDVDPDWLSAQARTNAEAMMGDLADSLDALEATRRDTWVMWSEPDTLRPWYVTHLREIQTTQTISGRTMTETRKMESRAEFDWR